MNEKETFDLIFPRKNEGGRTEIKSFSEIRGTMPSIVVGDEFVGMSPPIDPTTEVWEIIKQMKDKQK